MNSLFRQFLYLFRTILLSGIVILSHSCQKSSSSKPVIATNVGGNPELVDDGGTGYLVEPSNPALLADTIIKLLNNLNKAREMGRMGREKVERSHSMERMIKSYENMYIKSTIKKRTPSNKKIQKMKNHLFSNIGSVLKLLISNFLYYSGLLHIYELFSKPRI